MNPTFPPLPWHLTITTQCTNPADVVASVSTMSPHTSAVAQFPWDDPECLSAWAQGQCDAVLVETLEVTRLAQQSNVDTLHTMQQALTQLLRGETISMDALAFLVSVVTDSKARAKRLRTLSQTLHSLAQTRGLSTTTPLNVSVWLDKSEHAVINTRSGLTFCDESAFERQLTEAIASVQDVPDVPEDDHTSPFEELMAAFTQEWHPT